jgi:putative transposase
VYYFFPISRSSLYFEPHPTPERDLCLMRKIDKLHTARPFAGARMLRDMLRLDGEKVGRRLIATLMKKMGIEALYRKPNTSKKHPGHKIYPYLLRGLDITYLPMAKGFAYLTVIFDWYSRKVLSWRVSNTMDNSFCLEALEGAIARYDTPEIFNTDQGSQFTSDAFTGKLKEHNIRISMDGKGSWRDNVFVERLWRSVKYEEVYLKAYETVAEARRSIGIYLNFYNRERPHSSLDGIPPDQFYCNNLEIIYSFTNSSPIPG